MAKYLNIDGDYKLSVTSGGTITLNTGASTGTVVITGDLEVQGTTTTVDTATLVIEDRIITINRNGFDVSGKVSDVGGQRVAGIEVDRGTSDAYWVFDDNITTQASGAGAWVGRIGNAGASGQVVGIRTTSINTAGADLFLINQGTGIVTVQGTTTYQEQLFEYTGASGSRVVNFDANPVVKKPDGLVNAKGLQDYINAFFTGQFQDTIESGTITPTFVSARDAEVYGGESQIKLVIDNNEIGTFYSDRIQLQHLKITDTRIETTSENADLVLAAPGAGSVKIDDTLSLTPIPHEGDNGGSGGFPNNGFDADIENPDPPDVGIKIYAKSEGPAGTSLYFVNSDETQDELVSKKKSILFSMIF
jgi:hypothetical protein